MHCTTLTDGNSVYTYDILNRQTSVANGSGTTEYIYDARGRRVAKVNGGVTTHFIYDVNYRVIEERDNSETLLAAYTYGRTMDEPLTMERGGQTYYYHRDALGSITEVSDGAGTIVERYEYDVYGAVTIFDGSDNVLTVSAIGNSYLFTGRRYDPESDNYYYRARYYSHKLGRFLSHDPLAAERLRTDRYYPIASPLRSVSYEIIICTNDYIRRGRIVKIGPTCALAAVRLSLAGGGARPGGIAAGHPHPPRPAPPAHARPLGL